MGENTDESGRIQRKEKRARGKFAQKLRNGHAAIGVSFNNMGYRDGLKSQKFLA